MLRSENERIRSALELGEAVAGMVEVLQTILTEYPSGNENVDQELRRLLSTTEAAILRWRLEAGVRNGILAITEVPAWESDEFD